MNKFPFLILALVLSGCVRSTAPTEPEDVSVDTTTTKKPDVKVNPYDSLRKPDAVGEITDRRDGHVYHWVQIGNIRVFAENLAYVPKHGKTFVYTASGLDSAASVAKYGRGYDYEAMIDSTFIPDFSADLQGACPEGWWVPHSMNWSNITSRAKNAEAKSDSIFNDWAFSKEDGGSNTLGLNLTSTFGVDYDCDTAKFFADSVSNCRETKRFLVSYAAYDTSWHYADVYDRIIASPTFTGRYNVSKMSYTRKVNSGTATTALSYGNSIIRRNFEDFSYIRCFQGVRK